MSLICPRCQTAIELAQLASDDVVCPSCGSSIHLEGGTTTGWNPSADQRRLGKFELLDQVGVGAFGTVYKARDTELDRVVAIKVPRGGSLGSTSGDTERFLREARSVAQLRHPSIVSVHEVGQHAGLPYLVEDFVEGITLADFLSDERPAPRQAAELVAAVADALQYAHDHGVVHRDVKPSNIMLERSVVSGPLSVAKKASKGEPSLGATDHGQLTTDYSPKLMDFGLAKRAAGEATVTVEGQVLGTPAYMSPEQARGESHQVDGRSDVYSLGVILYQLLTGELPFKGNPRMLLHHVLHDEPKPPRKRDPKIARDLETICLKAMAKEPAKRYPSARGFADDLRRWLRGEPIQARPVGQLERTLKWVRRRPLAAAFIGFMVLFVTADITAALVIWHWAAADQRREALRQQEEETRQLAQDEARQLKVEYFSHFVRRRGAPEGMGPLRDDQARRRAFTYKFYRRADKVEKVEVVSGSGALRPSQASTALLDEAGGSGRTRRDECRYEYKRNDAGQVAEETAYDRNDQVTWRFQYMTHEARKSIGHYTDQSGFPRPRAASGAVYVEIRWDEDGFERELYYLDRTGKRRPGNDRVYGLRQEFDHRGLPVLQTYLGAQYQPIRFKDGYATIASSYDAHGHKIEEAYLGLDGQPTLHKDGYTRIRFAYDDRGNVTEESYHGLDGQPVITKQGLARKAYAPDERGNAVETLYLDPDGKPMRNQQGFARLVQVYDDRDHIIESTCFGPDGRLTRHQEGYARVLTKPDDRGNPLERSYLGSDEKPTLNKNGYARVTWKYDERGNATEVAYFGLDGRPTAHKDGFARMTQGFDEHNQWTEAGYFGPDGNPTLTKSGFAKTTAAYDDRGNVAELAFFGTDGKPIREKQGIARFTQTYDERGNLVEQTYYGPDGQLTTRLDTFARLTQTYDERGNVTGWSVFGTDGKPVLDRTGVAGRTVVYDNRDNLIEQTYLGLDGKPKANIYGIARIRWKHDAHGNIIEGASFDAEDQPVRGQRGNARWTWAYDRHGRRIALANFGPDGKPIVVQEGYSKQTWTYDDRGRSIALASFGVDGQPTLDRFGAAGTRWTYDDRGNVTAEAYFGVDGRPKANGWGVAVERFAYDDRGNQADIARFGLDRKPVLPPDGYTRVVRAYDDRGNLVEEAYFGVRREAVLLRRSGYARKSSVYDLRGHCVEETYFGVDGQPIAHKGGYARVVRRFDEFGKPVSATYYGVDGQPVLPGFLRDWLILAPIPLPVGESRRAESIRSEQIPDEAQLRPREGDKVPVAGTELIWKKHHAPEYYVDFNQFLGARVDDSVAYAVCYVVADRERKDLTIKLGSDDQARVYLNGQEVLCSERPRITIIDEDTSKKLTLNPGRNVLLVKVVNWIGEWSFCLRFTDADGNVVKDLKATLTPPEGAK